MKLKKTTILIILAVIVGCIFVSVMLLSNPGSQENTGISESEAIATIPEENTSIPEQESINEGEEAQQDPVSLSETTEQEEELQKTDTSLFHPEYARLIQLAEEVMQDPIKAQEETDRYVDENGEPLLSTEFFQNSDDPSQEFGYLIQDINGEGVKELMFGVNWQSEDNEEHTVFDLYTLKDEKAVHVFDGWWRNCYYPTANGDFINFWAASSDEGGYLLHRFDGEKLDEGEEIQGENLDQYGILYPYFVPFGTDWQELEDIDGNGQPEYVVFYGGNGDAINAHTEFVYVFNLEKIYRHIDFVFVEVYDSKYMDLDQDEEEEVVILMAPHVNSMPLLEYAVIKERDDHWEKLEMYQGKDIMDNSFPISVVKGEGQFEAKLSVAGLDKELIISFENRYNYWKKTAEKEKDGESWGGTTKDYYDQEIFNLPNNAVCATTSAWGVWDIQYGTYQGQNCLIAEQGIEAYSKFDYWGSVFIYFNYDSSGKIRILDFTFVPFEEE